MQFTERGAARRGRPFFADAPVSRLIAATGLSDAEFAQLSGAALRTVRAWRRGDKSTSADRYVQLVRLAWERFGADIFLIK